MGNGFFGESLTRSEIIERQRLHIGDVIQDLDMEITTMQVTKGRLKEKLRAAVVEEDRDEMKNVALNLRGCLTMIKHLQEAKRTLLEADNDVDKLRQNSVLHDVIVTAARSLSGASRLSSLPRFQAFAANFRAEASISHRLANAATTANDISRRKQQTIPIAVGKKAARREKLKVEEEDEQVRQLIEMARSEISSPLEFEYMGSVQPLPPSPVTVARIVIPEEGEEDEGNDLETARAYYRDMRLLTGDDLDRDLRVRLERIRGRQ
jgi:hypothetical protein